MYNYILYMEILYNLDRAFPKKEVESSYLYSRLLIKLFTSFIFISFMIIINCSTGSMFTLPVLIFEVVMASNLLTKHII